MQHRRIANWMGQQKCGKVVVWGVEGMWGVEEVPWGVCGAMDVVGGRWGECPFLA